MKKIFFVVSTFMLGVFLCGNSVKAAQGLNESQVTKPGVDSIVKTNNEFTFDLFSRYKTETGNIFFSPYSISSALAMVYEGAKGKTAEEIQNVFHFPSDASIRRSALAKINNTLNAENKNYKLSVANALWAQKGFQLLGDYVTLIKTYYGGKVMNVDFIKETEKSRITINTWVEKQTNEKIKDLIAKGLVDASTRLVLTNAIYFKGDWLNKFDVKKTEKRDFFVSSSSIIMAQMMCLTDNKTTFNYAETEGLQILELPYAGEKLSVLVLLPKVNDLKSLEDSVSAEKLNGWRNQLHEAPVDIYLPKFKLGTEYLLEDTLAEMGMPTAFSGNADFSGMTGKTGLCISKVIHKAFVEVNEEGTEAAAATAVTMKMTSAGPGHEPKRLVFNANHPFIFIIQQKTTGNILFIGRMVNPK